MLRRTLDTSSVIHGAQAQPYRPQLDELVDLARQGRDGLWITTACNVDQGRAPLTSTSATWPDSAIGRSSAASRGRSGSATSGWAAPRCSPPTTTPPLQCPGQEENNRCGSGSQREDVQQPVPGEGPLPIPSSDQSSMVAELPDGRTVAQLHLGTAMGRQSCLPCLVGSLRYPASPLSQTWSVEYQLRQVTRNSGRRPQGRERPGVRLHRQRRHRVQPSGGHRPPVVSVAPDAYLSLGHS